MTEPRNSGGATPITVNARPLIPTSRPTIAGVGAEAPLPQAVAQHDHRVAQGGLVLVGPEGPSEHRGHAEHVEEVAGHELGPDALAVPPHAEARGLLVGGQHPREGSRAPQLDVVGVREADERLARARAPDLHEAMGGQGPGQGLEQHRVQPGKQRGVGADADGQGQDARGSRRPGFGRGCGRRSGDPAGGRPWARGASSLVPRPPGVASAGSVWRFGVGRGPGPPWPLCGCGTSRSHAQNR